MVNKFNPSDLITLTLIREVGGPIFPTGIAKAISPQPKILLTSNEAVNFVRFLETYHLGELVS